MGTKKNNKLDKIIFVIVSILFIIPSIIYIIQKRTVLGFNLYYNFFITEKINKTVSTIIYLILFGVLTISYLRMIKNKKYFKDIKELLKYITIISSIFIFMLPWTSSDIFYYMGVGELDFVYKQNPYYITMKDYYEQNPESINNDSIFEQGVNNFWAKTTVVYGPIAQTIFKICSAISFKNLNICLLVFKIVNLIIHIANCYLIFKLTRKLKFSIIYGLNPFVLLEFLGMGHNDIIVVFFILLTLYYLIKKKNIYLSIVFLALATGIKYFTVLLLPIVILYHFRKETKISKRILRCIQYGVMFFCILIVEYISYFQNIEVILAILPQTAKYSKSIYSAMAIVDSCLMTILRAILSIVFFYYYIVCCLKMLFAKDNNIMKMLRKYNTGLILFILILTNCQQWYIVWLFATIMWQRPNTIRNIIGVSLATEIANSIYMFKSEFYIYDVYYIEIIACVLILWYVYTNKKYFKDGRNQIEKASIN